MFKTGQEHAQDASLVSPGNKRQDEQLAGLYTRNHCSIHYASKSERAPQATGRHTLHARREHPSKSSTSTGVTSYPTWQSLLLPLTHFILNLINYAAEKSLRICVPDYIILEYIPSPCKGQAVRRRQHYSHEDYYSSPKMD